MNPRALSSRLRAGNLAVAVPPAVAAFFFSTAAVAETYTFGGSTIEWTGREVIFRNGLTSSMAYPSEFHRDLTSGFTVRVVILQGHGMEPDMMFVIPPAGYIAIPESVTVEEHEQGTIIVVLEGLS